MSSWKILVVILPVFVLIDLVWLGVVMKSFYSQELGELARREGSSLSPRWGAAAPIYVLIPTGLVLFVRPLTGAGGSLWQALGWGATFGLVLYGMYGLTNLAVLEKWTAKLVVVDTAWGCAVCGIISGFMAWLDKR